MNPLPTIGRGLPDIRIAISVVSVGNTGNCSRREKERLR
jgi:hypothetical protein